MKRFIPLLSIIVTLAANSTLRAQESVDWQTPARTAQYDGASDDDAEILPIRRYTYRYGYAYPGYYGYRGYYRNPGYYGYRTYRPYYYGYPYYYAPRYYPAPVYYGPAYPYYGYPYGAYYGAPGFRIGFGF